MEPMNGCRVVTLMDTVDYTGWTEGAFGRLVDLLPESFLSAGEYLFGENPLKPRCLLFEGCITFFLEHVIE